MSSDPCYAASLAHKADLAVQHRNLLSQDKVAAAGGIRYPRLLDASNGRTDGLTQPDQDPSRGVGAAIR
jgi:hypothetical protein